MLTNLCSAWTDFRHPWVLLLLHSSCVRVILGFEAKRESLLPPCRTTKLASQSFLELRISSSFVNLWDNDSNHGHLGLDEKPSRPAESRTAESILVSRGLGYL